MEEIHLCLSDLLDQDLSSYEYFQSLSDDLKERAMAQDLRSFRELQDYVESQKW